MRTFQRINSSTTTVVVPSLCNSKLFPCLCGIPICYHRVVVLGTHEFVKRAFEGDALRKSPGEWRCDNQFVVFVVVVVWFGRLRCFGVFCLRFGLSSTVLPMRVSFEVSGATRVRFDKTGDHESIRDTTTNSLSGVILPSATGATLIRWETRPWLRASAMRMLAVFDSISCTTCCLTPTMSGWCTWSQTPAHPAMCHLTAAVTCISSVVERKSGGHATANTGGACFVHTRTACQWIRMLAPSCNTPAIAVVIEHT